jgi:hypothetical protein
MGISKSVLGGFSGRVGNIIGDSWKGISIAVPFRYRYVIKII